jgi:membrane protease YdiL (CAAX protease family)
LRWLGVGSLLKHTPFSQIAIGVLTAVAVTVTIRVLVGDSLPDFIPAEESSKPGFLYGMVAGYGEEVLFRMLLMPLFFFGAYKLLKARGHKQRVFLSAIAAIVLTAVLFVLLHELGETDGTIVWKLVATRFIVPGVVMGSLYFLFGPGFVIAMHSSMHVMIPLLFN